MQLGDDGLDGLVDAALEGDRVGAGGDVAQALVDQGLGQNGRGGGAVTCDVVGLLGNFLHQLGADALERIVEVDFLGDGDAILGDRGGAPLLVEHDVATLGAERHLDGVGQQVQAVLHAATGILIKLDDLAHWEYILPRCGSGPVPATDDRAWWAASPDLWSCHSPCRSAKYDSGTHQHRVQGEVGDVSPMRSGRNARGPDMCEPPEPTRGRAAQGMLTRA